MKRVPGEGMPLPADPKRRGDLVLRFNVEFPVYLPLANKNHVRMAFEEAPRADYIRHFALLNKTRRNIDDDVPLRRGATAGRDAANRLKFICET